MTRSEDENISNIVFEEAADSLYPVNVSEIDCSVETESSANFRYPLKNQDATVSSADSG